MKKAFTLVELLVVIGILGILMAVLVGTFGGSTESSRTAKCQSNLRNLAMAVHSYAQETVSQTYPNGYYPYAGSFNQFSGWSKDRSTVQARGWISWSTLGSSGSYSYSDEDSGRMCITNGTIWKAMKGAYECYVCPACEKKSKSKGRSVALWSYAMNAWFDWASRGQKPVSQSHRGRGYRNFTRAERTLLFAEIPCDEIGEGGDANMACDPILQYKGCEGSNNESIGFNHKDGKIAIANVCFADGHIEKYRKPKSGDTEELTRWLCQPYDDNGNDFDISFDGSEYKKVQ